MKKYRAVALLLLLAVAVGLAVYGWSNRLPQDPARWRLSHFKGCFDLRHPTQGEEYSLLSGTQLESTVQVLRGEADGPALYVVAGLHGDETAGWRAGNLLKEATLKAGTLYILSPANGYGAEHDQRATQSGRDLNRNFPGDPGGWDAQQLAAAILADLADKSPALVLDLHEAHPQQGERDKLGNSLICQSLDDIGELVLSALAASEEGALCSAPLTLFGSPPQGSLNRTVTLELGIPVITVESFREEPLETRVGNHLELAQFVLEYYGMR